MPSENPYVFQNVDARFVTNDEYEEIFTETSPYAVILKGIRAPGAPTITLVAQENTDGEMMFGIFDLKGNSLNIDCTRAQFAKFIDLCKEYF